MQKGASQVKVEQWMQRSWSLCVLFYQVPPSWHALRSSGPNHTDNSATSESDGAYPLAGLACHGLDGMLVQVESKFRYRCICTEQKRPFRTLCSARTSENRSDPLCLVQVLRQRGLPLTSGPSFRMAWTTDREFGW